MPRDMSLPGWGLPGLAVLAFVLGCGEPPPQAGPALTPAAGGPGVVSAPAAPVAPPPHPLRRFLPAGFSAYACLDEPGPWLTLLRQAPAPPPSSALTGFIPPPAVTGVAGLLAAINEASVATGLVHGTVVEVLSGGAALALAPDVAGGTVRFVAAAGRTGVLDALVERAAPRLAVPAALPTTTALAAGAPVTIRGSAGVSALLQRAETVWLLASDADTLAAALETAAGRRPGAVGAPLWSALSGRVSPGARAFLLADLPALLGRTPVWPSRADAVVLAVPAAPAAPQAPILSSSSSPSPSPSSSLVRSSQGLVADLSDEPGFLAATARFVLDPASPDTAVLRRSVRLRGPRVAGESVPVFLGGLVDLPGLGERIPDAVDAAGDADPTRLLAGGGSVDAVARELAARAAAAGRGMGLSWARDVAPWAGDEADLLLLWELKYPQAALLLANRDPKVATETLTRVRQVLEARGQVFASRDEGPHRVYYTRWQGVDPKEFEPSVVITEDAVVLATGRRVLQAVLAERERVEGTPAYGALVARLGGSQSWSVLLRPRLLDRFLRGEDERRARLTPANHGRCNANLVAIEEGRVHPTQARCPAGGHYVALGAEAACTVHGTVAAPRLPSAAGEGGLASVRFVRDSFEAVAVGAAPAGDDMVQITMVLQLRSAPAETPATSPR